MSTVGFLQRSLSKWKYVFILILTIACFAAILSLYVNRWIPDYSLSYSHLVAQQSKTNISFAKAQYRFPNYLILSDFKIFSDDSQTPLLRADKLTLGFSFPLLSSSIRLNSVSLDKGILDFPRLRNYWSRHGKEVLAWLKEIPHGNLKLTVLHGQILAGHGRTIGLGLKLQNVADRVQANGSWKEGKKTFYFEIDGHVAPSGFDVDKFTLKRNAALINLWGRWHGRYIDWNGYVFYDKYYILDIDGHAQLQDKSIVLKRLSFNLDKDNVYIAGSCSREELFSCDGAMALRRPVQNINELAPLKDIQLHLHVQNTLQGLVSNGSSDVHFLFDNSPTALQAVHGDFDGLKLLIVNGRFLSLKIKDLQSTFFLQGRAHMVPMRHVWASFNYARAYQKAIAMSADILSGHADSRIFVDTSSLPWAIKGHGRFEDLDISRLADAFSFFKHGRGVLAGYFNLQVSRQIELEGALSLHHGDFEGSDFQEWMAKLLQMPSLSHIGGM
ncbi:MAG: hypothetical protein KGJ11_08760, partial [Candidatus Omnitrophica bacterium]|nr:hypothetical protein [Candidatus Omnitrophota bacterium]